MRKYIPVILIIAFVLETVGTARAAVNLLYFQAAIAPNMITLQWETASEIENAGFYIQRSLDRLSGYSRISSFIPSLGDPFTGHYYEYNDLSVLIGYLYYYKLEIVSASGSSEFTDAISAMIIGPTPTSTRTVAITLTLTPTTSLLTATLTATSGVLASSTPTPTSTSFVGGPARPIVTNTALVPTATPTIQLTSTKTPTTTLAPFPEITIIFPIPTRTNTSYVEQRSTPPDVVQSQANEPAQTGSPPRLIFLVALIVIIWLVLVGFLVYYLRQTGSS